MDIMNNIITTIQHMLSGYTTTGTRGYVYGIVTIAILWFLYRMTTRAMNRYIMGRVFKPDNAENFMLLWRYVWYGIIFVFVLTSFSGSIAALGISAAFLGMIMGWSLQAPVTGIAAWLMIILKRPFKIGDRIIIAGITGDVLDITLTHILLNQVGGTVVGEEKSGRSVLIPNAILFQQIIHNYTLATKFLLDEVTIVITFESDFKEAERILIKAAKKVTKKIIAEIEQQPFVRAEIADSGVRLRLRYKSLATARQYTSSEMSKTIIESFNKSPNVHFAYPHSEVIYRMKGAAPVAANGATQPVDTPKV